MSANLLQDGAAWLGNQIQQHAQRSVTLEQGDVTIDDLLCSAQQFEHEIADQDGFTTKILSYDWTIVAADLVDNSDNPFALQRGALITETFNGVTSIYEAMPLGNKPVVERLDSSGILLTLHTKKIQ